MPIAEPKGRYNLADLATTAKKAGAGYTLNGHKAVVIGAPWADHLIVTARTAGGQRDEKGVSVFVVDKEGQGRLQPRLPDGRWPARLRSHVRKRLGRRRRGDRRQSTTACRWSRRVVDEAIAALSAEAIGGMKVLNDATVEYCKTRKQFGVPIGKFQVLQHRMVDMFMDYEQSVSMTYMVTLKLGESETATQARPPQRAKVQIGKAGRFIGQNAVQIHGGMGMTDELNVGHYFKRLTMIDTMFGNTDWHLRRYTGLSSR